jgi:hypothetical protein
MALAASLRAEYNPSGKRRSAGQHHFATRYHPQICIFREIQMPPLTLRCAIAQIIVAFAALACSPSAARAVLFADTTFNNANWSSTVLAATAGTTTAAAQQASGGNPGTFRRMTHNLPGVSEVYVFHEYLPALYSPTSSGPITRIDYSEDHIEFNPPFTNAKIGWTAALRQGSKVFVAALQETPNTSWEAGSLNNLKAADFSEFNGTAHPDFSANAPDIHLGYLRWNTHFAGPITIDQGIDNWRMSVVPEPSPVILFSVISVVATIARNKKRPRD